MIVTNTQHAQVKHPAKFSPSVLAAFTELILTDLQAKSYPMPYMVLDPFAGVGGVHVLRELPNVKTFGVELEPEWANQHPMTRVGNALSVPFAACSMHAIITSPCYGNRMADRYDGRDGSKRVTYRIQLGRMPSEGSAAVMQWGKAYKAFHEEWLWEAGRVLKPRGMLAVNMSNHIRGGREMRVVEWWRAEIVKHGFTGISTVPVDTPRMRMGENHELRVANEVVLVAYKPDSHPRKWNGHPDRRPARGGLPMYS